MVHYHRDQPLFLWIWEEQAINQITEKRFSFTSITNENIHKKLLLPLKQSPLLMPYVIQVFLFLCKVIIKTVKLHKVHKLQTFGLVRNRLELVLLACLRTGAQNNTHSNMKIAYSTAPSGSYTRPSRDPTGLPQPRQTLPASATAALSTMCFICFKYKVQLNRNVF